MAVQDHTYSTNNLNVPDSNESPSAFTETEGNLKLPSFKSVFAEVAPLTFGNDFSKRRRPNTPQDFETIDKLDLPISTENTTKRVYDVNHLIKNSQIIGDRPNLPRPETSLCHSTWMYNKVIPAEVPAKAIIKQQEVKSAILQNNAKNWLVDSTKVFGAFTNDIQNSFQSLNAPSLPPKKNYNPPSTWTVGAWTRPIRTIFDPPKQNDELCQVSESLTNQDAMTDDLVELSDIDIMSVLSTLPSNTSSDLSDELYDSDLSSLVEYYSLSDLNTASYFDDIADFCKTDELTDVANNDNTQVEQVEEHTPTNIKVKSPKPDLNGCAISAQSESNATTFPSGFRASTTRSLLKQNQQKANPCSLLKISKRLSSVVSSDSIKVPDATCGKDQCETSPIAEPESIEHKEATPANETETCSTTDVKPDDVLEIVTSTTVSAKCLDKSKFKKVTYLHTTLHSEAKCSLLLQKPAGAPARGTIWVPNSFALSSKGPLLRVRMCQNCTKIHLEKTANTLNLEVKTYVKKPITPDN